MNAKSSAVASPAPGCLPVHSDGSRDTSVSSTLIRGLEVLHCFHSGDECLSNADIASRLQLNKATVSRLCKTLMSQHYLRKDPTGRFRLAPRILTLSYPMLASSKWRLQATGPMKEIADFAKGNASLAVMSGSDMVFVHVAGEPPDFPHIPEIGMSGPLPSMSTGRALLSMLDIQEREKKYLDIEASYPGLLQDNQQAIDQAFESIAQRDFCVAFGDWRDNIYAVSSPLGRTPDGLCISLNCGVPSYRSRREDIEHDLGPRVASVAQDLRQLAIFQSD